LLRSFIYPLTSGLTWLGLLAGGLTTASFVPQVRKIWKTKSAEAEV
jgi:uncharacterized protein with PQ loop repeat